MKKATDIKQIQEKLQDTTGGRHQTIIDDDEEEGGEDVYMYPAEMHPDE